MKCYAFNLQGDKTAMVIAVENGHNEIIIVLKSILGGCTPNHEVNKILRFVKVRRDIIVLQKID